jgi:hypothetical protein
METRVQTNMPSRSGETAYAFYESLGSLDYQNRNETPKPISTQFPRGIYVGEPYNQSKGQPLQYMAPNGPRDTSIDYFVYAERDEHPAHFSRFGYPWCPNGYCVGNHPGRYNTPLAFRWQTSAQPAGMAPKRFYEGKWVDPNYCSSTAYNEAYIARQNIV